MKKRERERQAGRLLRTAAAAEYVGNVSTWTIRHWILTGQLAFVRFENGPYLVDKRDLDGLIERTKTSNQPR